MIPKQSAGINVVTFASCAFILWRQKIFQRTPLIITSILFILSSTDIIVTIYFFFKFVLDSGVVTTSTQPTMVLKRHGIKFSKSVRCLCGCKVCLLVYNFRPLMTSITPKLAWSTAVFWCIEASCQRSLCIFTQRISDQSLPFNMEGQAYHCCPCRSGFNRNRYEMKIS